MKNLMNSISAFIREDEGLTTVEYAIAGTLVGLAVVTAFTQLGTQVGLSIDSLKTAITP
ncbi:MAG: Flp family type IVb pilin [Gammaproteobacteria bacterium]|jgi:pilus assembly protein Flp/PilA